MKRDPYLQFANAKANAIPMVVSWVGSVLGPLLVYGLWGEYYEWGLYLGLCLTGFVAIVIFSGMKYLKANAYSDFAVRSVVPLLLPLIALVLAANYT